MKRKSLPRSGRERGKHKPELESLRTQAGNLASRQKHKTLKEQADGNISPYSHQATIGDYDEGSNDESE